MLLRGTSAKSALALVGLLGLVSGAAAQPPAAAKPPSPGAIAVGTAVGDSVGMVALPIRAAAESVGGITGSICGRVSLGQLGASNRFVYLVEGGKVVASAKTDANGGFELVAPRAGEFTFMTGPFDANGAVRKMVRLDAAEGATQAVVMQQKGAAPGALAGGAAQESTLSAVGNRASGNAGVVFSNGQFLLNGQPVPAGNEYANLEAGSFRGAVTSLDDAGVRAPLAGANLYVIRRGQVVARTVSGPGGSFTVSGLGAGGYTLLATVGGYGVAEVSLNGIPGVDHGVVQPVVAGVPAAAVAPAPFASPYFAGTTAGVPGAVAVRFPFSAIAVQRIALRDGVAAPVGAPTADAEFRMEGADEVLVKVAFSLCQPGGALPPINLSPAPWEDLRVLIGNAQFDAPIGLAPTPLADLAGAAGGFGGGGGGGLGAGAFLPFLALPFLGGDGGDDGDNPGFVSPFRPR
jgi:hypothetical protein